MNKRISAMNKAAFLLPFLILPTVLPTGGFADPTQPANRTPVEHLTKRPEPFAGGLATTRYAPSERERPFFDKLDPQETVTGGDSSDYSLDGKDAKFIGWFGIVREVAEDAVNGRTTLTVEHKYFDGLTDAHIQAVSFNGGGDFRVVVGGVGHEIPPLSLVTVYGSVSETKGAGMPCVNAVFVRDWHWGTFTFLADYGTQKGSERWRKQNRVSLDDIYKPFPSTSYYEERLGKRGADDPLYRRLLKPAGELRPDTKRVMIELIESLNAANLFPVITMIEKVQKLHEERAAVAVLLAAMREEDEIPSWSVTVALGRLAGPNDLPKLVGLLSDARPAVRCRAVDAIMNMHNGAAPAVPALAKALRDAEPRVRLHAASALGAIGLPAKAAVGPLKESLKDHDVGVRLAAASALWDITFEAEPTVSTLIAGLKDADRNARFAAAEALDTIGPPAAAAGPALIAALKDGEQFVRYSAAWALGSIRPDPKTAIVALMASLKDEDSYVRARAAEALGRYGSAAQPAVSALVTALKDESEYVRCQSAESLGEIGPPAAKAVPALINALEHDPDEPTRGAAADALRAIDVKGVATIPALMRALGDEHPHVRRSAAGSLGKIGANAKAALPALQTATKDEDPAVRIVAAEAIWKVARDGETAIPVLMEAFKAGHFPGLAAQAVQTIGPPAKGAVPYLIKMLRQENGYAQNVAAQALGSIGSSTVEAIPALVDALRTRDGFSPCAVDAAESLWKINRHPRAIPVLIEMVKTDNGIVSAAAALGRIGPAAREALPALRDAANNPNPEFRKAADEAIKKVSGS